MDWKTIEMMGYAYYAEMGYRILLPIVDTSAYDFVAEKSGIFIKVNVKVAGLRDNKDPNSWAISQSSGGHAGHHKKENIDIFLSWLPSLEKFIEIQGDFFNVGNSKSRRIPKKLYKL